MRLKAVRVLREITQIELQQETGIDRARISFIENGHVIPREDEKEKSKRH